jgi:gas vesicle protein
MAHAHSVREYPGQMAGVAAISALVGIAGALLVTPRHRKDIKKFLSTRMSAMRQQMPKSAKEAKEMEKASAKQAASTMKAAASRTKSTASKIKEDTRKTAQESKNAAKPAGERGRRAR